MEHQHLALVVDDEPQMLDIVTFALETQAFSHVSAKDAVTAWQLFRARHFDLVVLDVMLPQSSGLSLCRRIREVSDVPVLLLTAKSGVQDRIAGLEAGADDYVTKPFHPRELALRAEAIVRRSAPTPESSELVHGPLRISQEKATVHGRYLHLSALELRLLRRLASAHGQPVSFRDLLLSGWQIDEGPGGREMLKTALYRVRKALHGEGLPRAIRAVRGVGYELGGPGG
ncbi:DNA-binding response regulator [Arthrobacter pityocampae]|uniref:DNA-binding response regulator n=1 Tax=Arthrobacter pityocampae TaxID=547334 RepID=A0A2S5IVL3_9MICC|nr:response regulator transcription factor [Arthrobacter pityocampae]PPB48608.1 DNA-binding response regulator [Arthrobacter pityocampae]